MITIYETILIRRFILMGWRTGTGVFAFDRSLWRSEPIKCLPFHPLYKKGERRLWFLSRIPFHLPETLKYLASLRIRFTYWFIHLIVKHFTITTRDAKAPPLPKTPRSDKAYHGSIGTRMAETQS